MILSAFKEAHLDQQYLCAIFGTIAQFQVLSPSRLGESFQALATLPDTVNLEAPSLQMMVLGKGSDFATRHSLHSYYNSMIEGYDESEPEFVDFANLGFSLIVQGGHRDHTAAAVSFVIQPDGIFVDVMAVSHSHHPRACKLTKDFFHPTTQSQRALLRSVEGGTFCRQGLETFRTFPLRNLEMHGKGCSLPQVHKGATVVLCRARFQGGTQGAHPLPQPICCCSQF
jgi:hypothetical protein